MPLAVLPTVIGHRCARAVAPENTLAGLERAARMGVGWVEVDVRLTSDGVPVLLHDPTLDRTTNGTGLLSARSAEAVRGLDAGRWFADAFTGTALPTLDVFLRALVRLGLGVNLELKTDPDDAHAVAQAALAVARTVWPGETPPVLISSFDPAALESAKALASTWPRGLLLDNIRADWRSAAERVEASAIIVNHQAIKGPESVSALTDGGRTILSFTVNDPARARQLRAWGISAVITDRPDQEMMAAMIRPQENVFIYGSMMTARPD